MTLRSCHALPVLLLLPVLMAVSGTSLLCQRNTLKFDNFTMQQGLSDNYLLCILQDRFGFLWFGTRDGLNRYDGNHCIIYRHDINDPGSLSDGSINSILEDRDGTIWIGTHAGGLNRFDRRSESFVRIRHDPRDPESIPDGIISMICEDDAGSLWIVVEGAAGGLCRLDKKTGRFARYYHNPSDRRSLSSNRVTSVCRDSSGRIWIGTADKGLNRYDRSGDDFINDATDPLYGAGRTGTIASIHADARGGLWLRSLHHILRMDMASGTLINYTAEFPAFRGLASDLISSLFIDRSDLLWVSTVFGGLHVFNLATGARTDAVYNPADRQSIGSNQVRVIAEDRSGNIWIGTDNGVARFNPRSWNLRYIQHDPLAATSLSGKIVRSIWKEPSGDLWAGTEARGLNRVDAASGRIVRYTGLYGEGAHSNINVLYQGRSGELWIGSSRGLHRYNPRSKSFSRYPAITDGNIWAILESRDGTLWVGSFYGLSRIDPGTGRSVRYRHRPGDGSGIGDNKIFALHEDRNGIIWIGTDNGLDRFDRCTGRFTHYAHDPGDAASLSNNRIWYIHEDAGRYLWIGTSGGGVNRFDPATGRALRFTEKDGLASNTVCGILEDERGRLWISTNNGISRLDPHTRQFRNYSARDGFYISQFHFKACFRDTAGYLYFGGTDGILSFHPDSLQDNLSVPALALTSFKVLDRELALDSSITMKREIRLDHTRNFFTIEFAALDFTNPKRNRYSYRLEDFDTQWRSTDGERPYAEYTNVPPGRYLFRLRGSNSDGVWNGEAITVAVVIEPAYWQTWWFRAALVSLLAALVSVLVMLRIRNMQRKGELRQLLVEYQLQALRAQMNPHFIFNALNSILHFIARHDSEAAQHYLSRFAKLIRLTLEHSKSHLIPLADDLESLRFYVELEQIRFEKKFAYEFSIGPGIDPYDIEVPPMLIQPYVENAIKHGLAYKGEAGTLAVMVSRHGAHVLCSVIDDGVGRKRSEELKTGIARRHRSQGMEATKKRLEALEASYGGKFQVEVIDLSDTSGNAAGTRVDIYIPMEDA